MINIPASPYTRPEMFLPDVMVDDEKWYPLGTIGKVRPLLFDVSNGGWISILKAEAQCTIQRRHRHADEQGNAESYDDVFLRLDHYVKHCRAVGLGEDWARSLIR